MVVVVQQGMAVRSCCDSCPTRGFDLSAMLPALLECYFPLPGVVVFELEVFEVVDVPDVLDVPEVCG
jgi:hypothetical protein